MTIHGPEHLVLHVLLGTLCCPLSAPVLGSPPHRRPLSAAVLTWMLLLRHPLLHWPRLQSPGLPGSRPPLASPSPPPGCQGPPASRAQLLPAPEGGGHKGALVTTAGAGQPDAWVLLAPSWRGWGEAASLAPPSSITVHPGSGSLGGSSNGSGSLRLRNRKRCSQCLGNLGGQDRYNLGPKRPQRG